MSLSLNVNRPILGPLEAFSRGSSWSKKWISLCSRFRSQWVTSYIQQPEEADVLCDQGHDQVVKLKVLEMLFLNALKHGHIRQNQSCIKESFLVRPLRTKTVTLDHCKTVVSQERFSSTTFQYFFSEVLTILCGPIYWIYASNTFHNYKTVFFQCVSLSHEFWLFLLAVIPVLKLHLNWTTFCAINLAVKAKNNGSSPNLCDFPATNNQWQFFQYKCWMKRWVLKTGFTACK